MNLEFRTYQVKLLREMALRVDKNASLIAYVMILALLWMLMPVMVFGQSAQITESTQTIKTYPFGDPSPVPILHKKPEIYPYFRFDGYSETGRPQEWKVVSMENEHIRLSILPEVGGKVFGAVEKSTGKEFIYKNDVLKFRDIALRGPWASGGIEFNFGYIGHTPATATPVNYVTKRNSDGSKSVYVGGLDLPSRTQWRVEIRLPQDKARFQTNSFWYNPTSFHQSYYQWMNAAIAAGDDLQMYFPGTNYIWHDGKGGQWPVNEEGENISFYKNNNFGSHKSYHVLGKYQDYSAAYWHDANFGYGYWSRHDEMPGQKVWMWAQSRAGAIWEDLLTDTAGQYVEVQSGRLFNQGFLESSLHTPFDQYLFEPQTFDSWTEYWFPIRQTGGVTDASPYGTMHVQQRDGQKLSVRFHAIAATDEKLVVTAAGKPWKEQEVQVAANEGFETEITLPENVEEYSVTIGSDLQYQHPEKKELQRPIKTEGEGESESIGNTFQRAEEHLGLRQYGKALSNYKQVVGQVPDHRKALTRLAELYTRRAEYQRALGYVRKVLKEDTYDPAANFMYGTIKRRVDELTQAREAFGWAARSMKYRSAGFTQMAELYLMEDHFDDAIYYARKALAFNTNNMAARQTRAAAHRLLGENEKASREIDDILTTDPLNHFGRFERYLLNPDTKNRKQFTSLIRNEMPHETYLELAIRYAELHRVEAARKVLELAPRDPMVHYWQAYLHRENSEKRDEYLRKAANQSPRLVYPFRSESMEVLQWAMGQWEQWQSTYYLGLIMWHKGRKEQAVDLLMACQSQPQFLPFYLTRGQVMKDKNPRQAGKDFRHALSMDEEKWRPYRALGQWYVRQGAIEKAVPLLERAHEKFADNYYIGMLYASVLNKNQQYSEALEVLEQLTVLPYEGAQRGHQLYEHAHLMLALEKLVSDKYREASDHIAESLKWPEHLGAGRPYDPDNRFQDYLEAIIYEHKNEEQSTTLFDAILAYSKDHWSDIKAGEFTKDNFVSYQVLRDLGRDQKADHLRNQFEQKLGEEKVNALTLGKEANSEIGNDASGNEDLRWFNLLRKISSDN